MERERSEMGETSEGCKIKEDEHAVDAEEGRVKDSRKKTGREERERMREQY